LVESRVARVDDSRRDAPSRGADVEPDADASDRDGADELSVRGAGTGGTGTVTVGLVLAPPTGAGGVVT
jgi:hypothetical protein